MNDSGDDIDNLDGHHHVYNNNDSGMDGVIVNYSGNVLELLIGIVSVIVGIKEIIFISFILS